MPKAVPIRIRGKDYPSVVAAAKAIGVSAHAIHRALDNGTIETVGLPEFQHASRFGNTHARRYPFTAFGRSFSSRAEAARQLGVTKSTITNWLRHDPDRLMVAITKLKTDEGKRRNKS